MIINSIIKRGAVLGLAGLMCCTSLSSLGAKTYAINNTKMYDFNSIEEPMDCPKIKSVDIMLDNDKKITVGVVEKAKEDYGIDMYLKTMIPEDYEPVKKETSVVPEDNHEVSLKDLIEYKEIVVAERKEAERATEEARKAAEVRIAEKSYSDTTFQGGLVDIAQPDENYGNVVVNITGHDREILENLVYGEAGGQGFIGAALVAQTLKDTYLDDGYSSIDAVRRGAGYCGSISRGTNQDCKDAVTYVFDQGGYAVKHRLHYFYAPAMCNSSFHESQNFIIHYKDARFFDRWN